MAAAPAGRHRRPRLLIALLASLCLVGTATVSAPFLELKLCASGPRPAAVADVQQDRCRIAVVDASEFGPEAGAKNCSLDDPNVRRRRAAASCPFWRVSAAVWAGQGGVQWQAAAAAFFGWCVPLPPPTHTPTRCISYPPHRCGPTTCPATGSGRWAAATQLCHFVFHAAKPTYLKCLPKLHGNPQPIQSPAAPPAHPPTRPPSAAV